MNFFKNLKKLPKEKQQHLALVIFVALGAVIALGPFRSETLGFGGLVSYQLRNLEAIKKKTADAEKESKRIQDAVKHASQTERQLVEAKKSLAEAESDIASGDLYSWVVNTLRQFKAGYQVDIPQFTPIGLTTDVSILPGFPYKQASLSLSGTAHYHDLGRFLSDLENQFPHMRVLNLNLDLNSSPTAEDQETIAFKMDIVTLVKTTSS